MEPENHLAKSNKRARDPRKRSILVRSVGGGVICLKITMRIIERIMAHLDQNVLGQATTGHPRVENGEVLVVEAMSQHNATTALKG